MRSRFSSLSRRWVVVAELTIIVARSSLGFSSYGLPERRRVARRSNSSGPSSNGAKFSAIARSKCRDSREIRPITPIGEVSRSGRSCCHCSRIASTASAMAKLYLDIKHLDIDLKSCYSLDIKIHHIEIPKRTRTEGAHHELPDRLRT